jgi:hypothetical protein
MASGKSDARWQPCLVAFIFRQDNRKRGGGFIEKTWLNNQEINAAFSISLRASKG